MKIKGVNLGNWLVLEKWMSPALFEGTTAEDEYYLPRQLSPEVYEARIKIHRAEYISERDFVIIKRMGMDTVRIPVPYFIFGDREPFIGCIEELDKALNWAERYGLKILIDLHTAPESQNGFDNGGICGVCKWAQNPDEVEFVHTVLERLAKRYGHREGLWGIEAINEPIMEGMWELFDVPNRYPAVDKEMEQYFPVICGEWCLFNSLACGYDTNGGKNVFNNVENVGESVVENDKKAQIYCRLAKVQIDAWNQGSGYFYWNYKLLIDTVNEQGWIGWDSWDLDRCVNFGWFPVEKGEETC